MNRVVVIAEAGVNHNGSVEIAKQLIDVAKSAGADYVKFQTFIAKKVVVADAQKADYQKENTGREAESQLKMLQALELSKGQHDQLIAYCKQQKIKFLSTAFDLESADYLNSLQLDYHKIPSGEITNLPYLEKIASFGQATIVSTGMCDLKDIEDAMNVLIENGLKKEQITILHCNTEYPTPYEDVNLKAMLSIGETFGVKVGYSDHTLGIEVPIAAVAMGAVIIEKHFTLANTMEGPDHAASLQPKELKAMITSIRNVEASIGSSEKRRSKSEAKNVDIARRSIHMSANLAKGSILGKGDVVMLRPGNGISPMELPKVLGREINKNLSEHHRLSYSDLV